MCNRYRMIFCSVLVGFWLACAGRIESSSALTQQAPLSTDIPWSVGIRGLYFPDTGTFNGFCTGSILSKHFILTASHCLQGPDKLAQIVVSYATATKTGAYTGSAILLRYPDFGSFKAERRGSLGLPIPWPDIGLIYLPTISGIGLTITSNADIFVDSFSPQCASATLSRRFSAAGWGNTSSSAASTGCVDNTTGSKRFGSGFLINEDQCNRSDFLIDVEQPDDGPHLCGGDSGAAWIVNRSRWLAFAVHMRNWWEPFDHEKIGIAIAPFLDWIENASFFLEPRHTLRRTQFTTDGYQFVRFREIDLGPPPPAAEIAIASKWLGW